MYDPTTPAHVSQGFVKLRKTHFSGALGAPKYPQTKPQEVERLWRLTGGLWRLTEGLQRVTEACRRFTEVYRRFMEAYGRFTEA